MLTDSLESRWHPGYTVASGHPLTNNPVNLNAVSQNRPQIVLLYELASASRVKDILSWLIARDRKHQNQWSTTIKKLGGDVVTLSTFPRNFWKRKVYNVLFNFSEKEKSATE